MQNNNENKDNLAAIGIGAMIVFIALILVAAVAAAVIIQTAEKLQQNAQSTGDDTTDEMSGKVTIMNVFVHDADNYMVYFRLSAGSDDTADDDILWQVSCDDGAGNMQYIAGDFQDGTITRLDGTALATAGTAAAGVGYRVDINALALSGDDCGPDAMFTADERATLYLHVVGGGTTYDVLKVNDNTLGAVVV
jgi:flagellin FlaB